MTLQSNPNDPISLYRSALQQSRRSVSTVRRRVADVVRLQNVLETSALAVTFEQLRDYTNTHSWSAAYRKSSIESFCVFYRWAFAEGLIDVDPALRLVRVQIPHSPANPAIPEEVVVEAFEAGNLYQRAAIALMATMGLRRSEVVTLQCSDRVGKILRITGKGGRVRELTLDAVTLKLLTQLEAEGATDYYFPGRFGGHLHHCTLYKWVKPLLGEWTPHSCRRRAGVAGHRVTKDLPAIMQFYGHSSLESTQRYLPVMTEAVAAISEAASLAIAPTSRRIAGAPPVDTSTRATFIARLADVMTEAREHGIEIVLR